MSYTTLVVVAGVTLLGAGAGLIGTFAVLRRRALVGDTLAHAALPGVCLAFLVVGERNLPAMLMGAFLSGILGLAFVALLRRTTRIKDDAALGVVLSVFYGAGIVLFSAIQKQSGASGKAGLDSYFLGATAGMLVQDVAVVAGVVLVCLLVVMLLLKEFRLSSFDPGFAQSQGFPAFWLDLLLMTLIAVTVTVGLPIVGVILMAALLIIPAAAARFWTDRLTTMLWLAAVFGGTTAAAGALLTDWFRIPCGPAIVLTATGVFLVSLLLAPQRGLLANLAADSRFRRRLRETLLLQQAGVPSDGGDRVLESCKGRI